MTDTHTYKKKHIRGRCAARTPHDGVSAATPFQSAIC
jgi:hypothetical protein